MKEGSDPREDQGNTKNVPEPPTNSEPVAAPGGLTEDAAKKSVPPGHPGPGSGTGGGGGDRR